MTRTEMELVLVLNAADGDEGYCMASSTWPRWTGVLDKLVAAGVATCEDIRDGDARRFGARYRINVGALRISAKTKPKRALSDGERAALAERLALARGGRASGSQKFREAETKNAPSQRELRPWRACP